jgi:glycosyltransferase involved in cell wall biosynthesis
VTTRQRLAVIFDAVEERWPSMDYTAEMLVNHLQHEHSAKFTTTAIRPRFFHGFDAARHVSSRGSWNANRLVTRFLTYPWQLRRARRHFELFHIADHTYGQLALALPSGRAGIYCHDLDAFEPALAPRGYAAWRVTMARLQLAGLRRAARVFFSTHQIRQELVARRVVDPSRLVYAPLGVSDEFFHPSEADLPPSVRGVTYVLNVAGNFPRKRLDLLFRVFSELLRKRPTLYLVQHGAELDGEQLALVRGLGISERLLRTSGLSRAGLAALYRHAQLVLLTSDREGFGLPAMEGLAAGAPVVLSDIPAFRETAGVAAVFCPPGDVVRWTEAVGALLDGSVQPPQASIRAQRARAFNWSAHGRAIAEAYAELGSAP